MKKRWIILISGILSMILLSGCLSGCKGLFEDKMGKYDDPWKYKHQEGEFYYYVDKWRYEEDSAVILGLVDEEKEIEELVIPKTLGGYPVKVIGRSWTNGFGGETRFYGIKGMDTEKIVINHSTFLTKYSFIDFNGTLIINSEQKYTNAVNYDGGPMVKNMKAVYINIPRDIDNDDSIYRLFNFLDSNHYGIIFYANGDDVATSGIINHIETDLKVPEEPTKQGYRFVDWYTDIDCSEIWNPEESKLGDKVTDVYAKWIEA